MAKMTQPEAVKFFLGRRKMTMAQLIAAVAKKTKGSPTSGSLAVVICKLRADGINIVTYNRGSKTKAVRYGIE